MIRRRWLGLAGIAVVLAAAALAGSAQARVLVRVPPRSAFCLDRIKLGVWYQSLSKGSRRYRVSVYNPAGTLILDKRGLATIRWRYFYFRPVGFKGASAGVYKTIYRSPSYRGPLVFRTRVYCGE